MTPIYLRARKYLVLSAKVIGVVSIITIIGFFTLRGYFLRKAIGKVQEKLETKYQAQLTIQNADFIGLSGVEIKGITLVPEGKDTLLVLDDFSLSIKFLYALIGDIRVKNIHLHDGYLQLSKKNGVKNFDAFLTPTKDSIETQEKAEPSNAEEINYAKFLYKLINKVLNQIPKEVEISNFTFKGIDESVAVNFNLTQFDFKDGQVNSNLFVVSNNLSQRWQLKGLANPSEKKADLAFLNLDTGRILIPYLPDKFQLVTGFKNARFQVNQIAFEDDELQIDGFASIQSFLINHVKISKKDVVIKDVNFKYVYKIGSNYLSLDSASTVNFNGFVFHPFIKFQNAPDTVYHLVVSTEKTDAQNFINALPDGLFSHMKGMEATGNFSYRLDFMYNKNHPDQLVFESALSKENFSITKYGAANLSKLNGEFLYVPIENGRPLRPIFVGLDNPSFTAIDQISPYLRKCVLTTEDPSFYYHRGFVTEAFKQSIAKNIRTGKFKRGASTISMQLMKNVFLTREKTMARKLEEILLVYILENNYISSKDRMFEVYLNIIEWGPDVYGIGEASDFYFKKKPADLTLSESLFLASIVPSPKHFMWRFNKDGSAKPYLERTFRYLANKMIYRQMIVPEDTIGFTHLVNVTGPARRFIIKNDSLINDTLIENELDLLENHEGIEED